MQSATQVQPVPLARRVLKVLSVQRVQLATLVPPALPVRLDHKVTWALLVPSDLLDRKDQQDPSAQQVRLATPDPPVPLALPGRRATRVPQVQSARQDQRD